MRLSAAAIVIFGLASCVEGIVGISSYTETRRGKPLTREQFRYACSGNNFKLCKKPVADVVDTFINSKSAVLRLSGGFSPLRLFGQAVNGLIIWIRAAWMKITGQVPADNAGDFETRRCSRRNNKLFAILGTSILGVYLIARIFFKTVMVQSAPPMLLFLSIPFTYAAILQVAGSIVSPCPTYTYLAPT
jgi:hypothetical protein